MESGPRRLQAVKVLMLAGMLLVIISQFTGLYYTFDEMNRYQRAPGYAVCYVIPLTVLLLQISVIIQYHGRLSRTIGLSLMLFTCLSLAASILQVFLYGISLNNITIVVMAALLYIFALQDLNREVEAARKKEIEHYKEEQKKEHILFEQTTEALASAIDAKDPYTHGHSARVAMYSTQIAREAGKTEEECDKVYFAAMLHDVGKIGVPNAVINKPGKLNEEEFTQIRLHPVFGNQILASIQQSPYLSIGAHYHHERYDGRGYPEGLKGDPDDGFDTEESLPTLILFDALDARIHEEEAKKKDLLYLEYARIRLDGRTECGDARKTETRMLPADDQTADIQGKISENGRADGAGYREFLLLRLDGENWESDTHAENEVHIDHTRSFPGWNIWKEKNKEGMDCTVRIRREGNRVMIETENLGIAVDSVTTVKDDVRNMYIALTGDQCALTEIRIDQNAGK